MPAMIKNSGKMWNRNNEMMDTKAIIPDSSYSLVYKATIDFCKKNGAFNPKFMGSVSNIGLMAKKAEEYGSHDKTFEIDQDGSVLIKDINGEILIEQKVKKGDKVLYGKYSGTEFSYEGKDYLIMRESDILAVL